MLNRNNGISQFMNSLNCYSTSKGHGGVRGGIITNTISWHIYLVSDAYQYCNCTARYLAFLDLRLLVRSRIRLIRLPVGIWLCFGNIGFDGLVIVAESCGCFA